MIGVYDFCGQYDWTFEWFRQNGGEQILHEYWLEAISKDSQSHAAELIIKNGFDGMVTYWGHTLKHEGAAYTTSFDGKAFRIDMQECPSKGFLIRNKIGVYHDYCDHCMGWIGPLLKRAGFVLDQEHNHCGQCWMEIRRIDDLTPPRDSTGPDDVRLRPDWKKPGCKIDAYRHTNDPNDKL